MIPEKLSLRNFLCYRDNLLPLEFDGIHVACLSGENGAGKSALLDAITWALWGKARAGDDELISLGEQEMEVDFVFLLGGTRYRVLRKRSRARRGMTALELQIEGPEGWRVLTGSTIRETQSAINMLLRMEYDTFINSAFLVQGKADEFTRRPPAERKRVLAEILGLSEYEQLEARAKARATRYAENLLVLDGQIEELEREAARRDLLLDLVRQSSERLAGLEQQSATTETRLRELQAEIGVLEGRRALRDELHARRATLCSEQDELQRRAAGLEQEIAGAEGLLARREAILAGAAALEQARAELELCNSRQSRWYALQTRQQECQSALEKLELELRHRRQLAAQALGRIEQALARQPALQDELEQCRLRLEEIEQLASSREQLLAEREALERRGRQVSTLLLERKDWQAKVNERRNSLIAAREEHGRRVQDLQRRLVEVPRWRQELQRLATQQARLERDAARLAELRAKESADAEQLGELRAASKTIIAQGEQVKQKLALLQAGEAACPVCGSELGHAGLAHIEDSYSQERAELLEHYRTVKAEADSLEQELEQLRREIAGLDQQLRAAPGVASRYGQLEDRLAEAEQLQQTLAEAQATWEELHAQLESGDYAQFEQAKLRRVEEQLETLGPATQAIERELAELDRQIRGVEKQLEERPAIERRAGAARAALEQIAGEIGQHQAALQQLRELDACLTRGDYGQQERATLAELATELAALGYSPEGHEQARLAVQQLLPWAAEERQLNAAQAGIERDRRALQEVEKQLGQQRTSIAELETQLAALTRELAVLPSLALECSRVEATLREQREHLAVAQRDLGELKGDLRRAEEAATEVAARRAQRCALLEEKELYEELARAFGKKGVQAMLIETAIPELEREANALLGRMTDNQMHLSFETQRDTKKGDTVETLEIKIADLQGTRDYALYSGGEAFRVNFAIRIALSKLLARRAGASLQTLILDEGFGTQDGRGRERIVEAITSVQHDFARILVITHIQELKDLFPAQIEIIKTREGSYWSVS